MRLRVAIVARSDRFRARTGLDFRFHWLRTLGISLMAQAGMKPELSSQRVGHTVGGALTNQRYWRLRSREVRDALTVARRVPGSSASGSRRGQRRWLTPKTA